MPRTEALRRARMKVASASATEHPYYWAGFVAHGARRENPVLRTPPSLWPWFLAGALAGIAGWLLVRRVGRLGDG